jgi:hypothetical protein
MEAPDRAAPRHILRQPVAVERVPGSDAPPHLLGYARNVSATGMFLQCPLPPPPGTSMKLRVDVPGEAEIVVVDRAQVVWVREYDSWSKLPAGMGVHLDAMRPSAEIKWADFCRTLR